MPRRRSFVRGAGAIRRARETTWFSTPPTVFNVAAGSALQGFSLNAAALAKRPFTILRTHFHVGWISDQIIASEAQFGAVGMCIVSSQAAAIGVTAVPTPLTDIGSELWYLHQVLTSFFTFSSAVGTDSQGMTSIDIDSKAMRKVNEGEDALIVFENAASPNSEGIDYLVAGRFLIKEQ